MLPYDITVDIIECWNRGNSVQETIEIVARRHRHVITFDEVRAIFVELSWADAA